MAESNGCAKALRRVTRGAAVSTSSAAFPLSNMRDWVATVGVDSTWPQCRNEIRKTKLTIRLGRLCPQDEFRVSDNESGSYFLAPDFAAASAYFLVKRSTRPAVSTS